jgi:hypothetical protein
MGGRRKMLLVTGLALLLVALLSAPTTAECPNGCSGNGACMAKDMCNCYKNYEGNDCLDRTCQFGYAHADTPKGDINMDQKRDTENWILKDSQQHPAGTYEYFSPDAAPDEAHFYMECSNKGLCDRSLGTCTCFDGYEGVACQRAACPNMCSGHGTCESIRELGQKAPGTLFGIPDNVNKVTYDLWDSRVTYGCRCDPWYHGADCSLRSCKVGVDPMFLSVGSATYEAFALHVYLDDVAYPSGTARLANVNDYVRLRLFDYHGEAYITDAIPVVTDVNAVPATVLKLSQANADAVAAAIKKIPNQTFRDVLCEPIVTTVGTVSDLDGYKSTRKASTHGLSVVCQFTENPGRLRTPEIADFNFDDVVNPKLKFAKVYTMEQGMDFEWFTEDTGVVVTAGAADGSTVTIAPAAAAVTDLSLFKVGPHVLLGKIEPTLNKITLAFKFKHTLPSNAHRFNAATTIVVDPPVTITADVVVGATSITVATALLVGDNFFFENQFYKVKSVSGFVLELDRPFGGNSGTGGDTASPAFLYKVTLPAAGFGYQYVSPCSGRGLCNTETGVCTCFKGYTNDNCDTQNILAL